MLLNLMQSTANAWQSLVALFAEMSPWVYGLFILGIIFCVIEMAMPGFGIFGVLGLIMIVLAIILRMVAGGNAWMLLFMVLISGALIGTAFAVVGRSIKKGKLSKTEIFSVGTAVSTGVTEGTKDFTNLVGTTATTLNALRPVGQARFEDGSIVDVIAHNGFIEANNQVKVILVEGQRVVVEQI